MATINDIATADQYTGNVNLGGGDPGAFNFKEGTDALTNLSYYTQAYNKKIFEQNITDRDTKITEIAKESDIDLNNLYGADRTYMVDRLEQSKKKLTEIAKKPLTTSSYMEMQSEISDAHHDYESGKKRAMLYYSGKQAIIDDNTLSEEAKAEKTTQLEEHFKGTDIHSPFTPVTAYKPVKVDIPSGGKEIETSYQYVRAEKGDADYEVKGTVANQKAINSLSTAVVSGVMAASKETGDAGRLQAKTDSEGKHYVVMAEAFNKAMTSADPDGKPKYFDKDGIFLKTKFEEENAQDVVFMPAYRAIVERNKESEDMVFKINSGQFTSTKDGTTVLDVNDFKAGITKFTAQGITPEQLVGGAIFQKYKQEGKVVNVSHTGEASQNARNASAIASSERETKLRLASSERIARLPYDEMKKAEKAKIDAAKAGGTVYDPDEKSIMYNITSKPGNNQYIVNPATANHVVSPDGKPLQIKNGVAVDSQGYQATLTGIYQIPISAIGAEVIRIYNQAAGPKFNSDKGQMEATGGLMLKPNKDGLIPVEWDNGVIVGIQTSTIDRAKDDEPDGAFVRKEEFKSLTDLNNYLGVSKYKPPRDIGSTKGTPKEPSPPVKIIGTRPSGAPILQ